MNALSNAVLAFREVTGTIALGSGGVGFLMGIEGVAKYPHRRFFQGNAERANDGIFYPLYLGPGFSLICLDCVTDEDLGTDRLDELSKVYSVWKQYSNHT